MPIPLRPLAGAMALMSMLLLPSISEATGALIETEFGRGYLGVEFGFWNDLNQESTPEAWQIASWNLSVAANQYKYRENSEYQLLRGHDFGGGLGFDYRDFLNFDAYAYTSRTQETDFTQNGLELRATLYFGGSHDPDESLKDHKTQSYRLGLGLGISDINQNFGFIPSLPADTDTNLQMNNEMFELVLGGPLGEHFSFEATGQWSSYSRSSDDLQELEDSPAAKFTVINITTSVAELPKSSAQLQLTYHHDSEWDLSFSGKSTELYYDGSYASETRLLWTQYFEAAQWSLGATAWTSYGDTEYAVVSKFGFEF